MQEEILGSLHPQVPLKSERRAAEMGGKRARKVKDTGMAEPREFEERKILLWIGDQGLHGVVQPLARQKSVLPSL